MLFASISIAVVSATSTLQSEGEAGNSSADFACSAAAIPRTFSVKRRTTVLRDASIVSSSAFGFRSHVGFDDLNGAARARQAAKSATYRVAAVPAILPRSAGPAS